MQAANLSYQEEIELRQKKRDGRGSAEYLVSM
jgi:hypothetical protein